MTTDNGENVGKKKISAPGMVLNLTELELNRVGGYLCWTLWGFYLMDGSLEAVRQLRHLVSQDPITSSVTLGVSHFERCALWIQVLYYPFYANASRDYDGDESDKIRQKKTSNFDVNLGEPVILRCQTLPTSTVELLLPYKCSPVEYFRMWPSLPAILEYSGLYTYEGSGFKATAAQQSEASLFLSGLKSLSSKPFHQVCSHILRTVAGFELCFAAKTWFGGFVGMMIFGASEGWSDDITDGCVEYLPEDEVKEVAAERLKISMERIALLKSAQPPPQTPKSEVDDDSDKDDDEKKEVGKDGKPKGPSTLSSLTAEHQALQAAVLQE
ncbi:hypothetical protein ZOSMA_24G00060 [Zostera marina]|uniref:Uncharacterized protein n=1 Tax=Zostera marina TaxID=29655 RepID=A0A0K9PG99_ZOSMR|nr:hypothetical protein ZOSMA_24G00060 [Zostera marina]